MCFSFYIFPSIGACIVFWSSSRKFLNTSNVSNVWHFSLKSSSFEDDIFVYFSRIINYNVGFGSGLLMSRLTIGGYGNQCFLLGGGGNEDGISWNNFYFITLRVIFFALTNLAVWTVCLDLTLGLHAQD